MKKTYVKQFKDLYKKRTGVDLDDTQAEQYANLVLGFVREVVKNDEKEN